MSELVANVSDFEQGMCEVVGNRVCVKQLGIGYVLVKGNKIYS